MKFFKLSVATLALAAATNSFAQDYPKHAITLVVPYTAGGPTDVVARSLGAELGKILNQPVVVENKTGAGGTIAPTYVSTSKPDGYTFLIHHNGMATATALYENLKYDPVNGFEHVGEVVDVPMTLLGRSDLEPNTFAEFVEYAKQNADKINLANAGIGAVSQLCGSMLQHALGLEFTTVPYQGAGPAMSALIAKQVDVLCDQTTSTIPQIEGKTVKLYGVTTLNRIQKLPNAPTLDEQGLKGFEVKVWHGIYAPKGTPKEVIATFNSALKQAVKTEAFQNKMAELGAEVVSEDRITPESHKAWLEKEIAKWTPVLKSAGMKVN